jgi:hypothetical protein
MDAGQPHIQPSPPPSPPHERSHTLNAITEALTICTYLNWPSQQKRDALWDEKLPEEYRIAIAKSLQNDIFAKVSAKRVG